jgi:hypothetical protein
MTRAAYPYSRHSRIKILAGLAAALLLVSIISTGSIATSLLIVGSVMVLLFVGSSAAKAAGLDASNPFIRALLSRRWRDAQSGLDAIIKLMPRALVSGPRGELWAPTVLYIDAAPATIDALRDEHGADFLKRLLDSHWITTIEAAGATPLSSGPPQVVLRETPGLPEWTFKPRRRAYPDELTEPGKRLTATGTAVFDWQPEAAEPQAAGRSQLVADPPVTTGTAPSGEADTPLRYDRTYLEPSPAADLEPAPLTLITAGEAARTRTSPAIAGRHPDCQLVLPPHPTISRQNATFRWADDGWWIDPHGTNPVLLNGVVLTEPHPISDGDVIRWGARPDAATSQVRIGSGR